MESGLEKTSHQRTREKQLPRSACPSANLIAPTQILTFFSSCCGDPFYCKSALQTNSHQKVGFIGYAQISDHPAHAQSIIRAFALHKYILLYAMNLLKDSEGPVKTARLNWVFAVHVFTFAVHVFAWRDPYCCQHTQTALQFDSNGQDYCADTSNCPVSQEVILINTGKATIMKHNLSEASITKTRLFKYTESFTTKQ